MISKKYKEVVAKKGKSMWLNRKSNVSSFVESLKNNYRKLENLKVLDAGCAQGRDSAEIASFGLNVTGLDTSKEFITQARIEHPKIKFDLGDITKLPYRTGEFDAVYCVNTLFYINPNKSLPELSRVLKTGGVLFITLDKKIVNLEEGETIHELNINDALKLLDDYKVLSKTPLKRVDEVPFRHEHDFYEMALVKEK